MTVNLWCVASASSEQAPPETAQMSAPSGASSDRPSHGSNSLSTPPSPLADGTNPGAAHSVSGESVLDTHTTPSTTSSSPCTRRPTLTTLASALSRRKRTSSSKKTPVLSSPGDVPPGAEYARSNDEPLTCTYIELNDHSRPRYNVFGSWRASSSGWARRPRLRFNSASSLPAAPTRAARTPPLEGRGSNEPKSGTGSASSSKWAHHILHSSTTRSSSSTPALGLDLPDSTLRTGLAAAATAVLAPTASALRRSRSANFSGSTNTMKLPPAPHGTTRTAGTHRFASRPPSAAQNRVAGSLTTLAHRFSGLRVQAPPAAAVAQQPVAGLGIGATPSTTTAAAAATMVAAGKEALAPGRHAAWSARRASMPPRAQLPVVGESHRRPQPAVAAPQVALPDARHPSALRSTTPTPGRSPDPTAGGDAGAQRGHASPPAPPASASVPPAAAPATTTTTTTTTTPSAAPAHGGRAQRRRSTLPLPLPSWHLPSALHTDLFVPGFTLRSDAAQHAAPASSAAPTAATETVTAARPPAPSAVSPIADDAAFYALLEQLRARYRASLPEGTASDSSPTLPTGPETIRPASSLSCASSHSTAGAHSPRGLASPCASTSTQTTTRPGQQQQRAGHRASVAACEGLAGAGSSIDPSFTSLYDSPEQQGAMDGTEVLGLQPGTTPRAVPKPVPRTSSLRAPHDPRARRAVRSWSSPMRGLWPKAGHESQDFALLARVGQASGQDSAGPLDRGRTFTDDAAWRKEVHALFVIRELVLGERSYVRYLQGLLDAVHDVLDRREEPRRVRERERNLDMRSSLPDLFGEREVLVPAHLQALAATLPRLIDVSQALLVHVGAHATAAGVGRAFADLADELEKTLVEWSKVLPRVMAGLRGSEASLPQSKRRRQSDGASLFRIGLVSLRRPTSIAGTLSGSSTINMACFAPAQAAPDAEAQDLDPEDVESLFSTLSLQLIGVHGPMDPPYSSWDWQDGADASDQDTTAMPAPSDAVDGTDDALPLGVDGAAHPAKRGRGTSLPPFASPTWSTALAPSKDLSPLDIVIMPTQRMIQHILLLQNLRGSTPVDSDAHARLGTALDIVRRISSLCDGAVP